MIKEACPTCGGRLHFYFDTCGVDGLTGKLVCDECVRNTRVRELTAERDALRAEVERLRNALRALLSMTNTIEVLGEWEATDINRSLRKIKRAAVDAVIDKAYAALSKEP